MQGSVRGLHAPPPRPFSFSCSFGENWPKIIGLRPPPLELVPPLGNPGSATVKAQIWLPNRQNIGNKAESTETRH